jgi:hypothetical protein
VHPKDIAGWNGNVVDNVRPVAGDDRRLLIFRNLKAALAAQAPGWWIQNIF